MKEMQVIGITGGVGSGKSTISKLLQDYYGSYLIGTDEIAHDLMEKDNISYNLIVEHFGKSVLDDKGNIDRKALGLIVYQDKAELLKLNSFTHPYVSLEVEKLIKEKQRENYSLACLETALPVEAGLKEFCDMIWFIYTPEDIRINRLKSSRNYSEERIKAIMNKQLSDEEYKKYATDVIINVNDKEQIKKQIDNILKANKKKNIYS